MVSCLSTLCTVYPHFNADVETIKYNNDEEYDGKGAKMRSMEDSKPSVLPSTGKKCQEFFALKAFFIELIF